MYETSCNLGLWNADILLGHFFRTHSVYYLHWWIIYSADDSWWWWGCWWFCHELINDQSSPVWRLACRCLSGELGQLNGCYSRVDDVFSQSRRVNRGFRLLIKNAAKKFDFEAQERQRATCTIITWFHLYCFSDLFKRLNQRQCCQQSRLIRKSDGLNH